MLIVSLYATSSSSSKFSTLKSPVQVVPLKLDWFILTLYDGCTSNLAIPNTAEFEVVNDILQYFESIGYSVKVIKSRTKKSLNITDGEADAFMYAVTSYIKNRPEAKSTRDIIEKYPRFSVFVSIEEGMKE